MKKGIITVLFLIAAVTVFAAGDSETEGKDGVITLELARFFGEPDDSLMDSTDLKQANSEAAGCRY